jgi:hypothetical protein
VGRNHDPDLTDWVCEKHHDEQHEQMRRLGISLEYEPDPVKRHVTRLRAAALYDRARADAMDRWADELEKEFLERTEP